MIEINQRCEVEGEYILTVGKEGSDETRTIGPFKNLITNQGLNGFGISAARYSLQAAMVGTSSTPPAFTDTNLGSRLRNTLDTQGTVARTNLGAPTYAAQITKTWRFPAGAAAGNLTEVGVGQVSSTTADPSVLFSHALIVDSSGNPVTLTVLSDEYLDVTYVLRMYPNLSDVTTTITEEISGTNYTFVSRIFDCTGFMLRESGTLYLYTGTPDSAAAVTRANAGTPVTLAAITSSTPFAGANSGTLLNASLSGVLPYTADSYVSKSRTVWSLSEANFALGIQGIYFDCTLNPAANLRYQITINPPIMKNNTQTLTVDFSISWSRRP